MPKTGEICKLSGHYKFSGHTDGTVGCHPTLDEKDIPMKAGFPFPPIRSCSKGAFWTYARSL